MLFRKLHLLAVRRPRPDESCANKSESLAPQFQQEPFDRGVY